MKKLILIAAFLALTSIARAGDGDVQDAIRVLFGGKEIRVRTPATNDLIVFDGTRWKNVSATAIVASASSAPTLQTVAVAGRTYDGTSGAVRFYNANTGSTNAITFGDQSAAGAGFKLVSNSGESGGVCIETWNGDTSARLSQFSLYMKATDGFETPSGQSLLNASLNLNSASTIVWRDSTNVFTGSNDIRIRRTAASTLTADNAGGGNAVFALVGAETIDRTSADATAGMTVTMGASCTGNGYTAVLNGSAGSGVRVTHNGTGAALTAYTANGQCATFVSATGFTELLYSDAAMGIDVGPYQDWYGRYITSSSSTTTFARTIAAKENATTTNTAGYYAIWTQVNGAGAPTETARFTSTKGFQLANGASAAVSAANTVSFRSNNGVAEVSQNGGAYAVIGTGGSSPWQTTSNVVNQVTNTDGVQIGATSTPSGEILRVTGNATRKDITLNTGASGTFSIWNNGTTSLTVTASGIGLAQATNCTSDFTVSGNTIVGAFYPTSSGVYDLGGTANRWKRLYIDYTNDTSAGTSGTVNKAVGRVRLSAGNTTYTLTNSYITAETEVFAQLVTSDTTALGIRRVTPGSGSVVIEVAGAAATGNVDIMFWVVNTN